MQNTLEASNQKSSIKNEIESIKVTSVDTSATDNSSSNTDESSSDSGCAGIAGFAAMVVSLIAFKLFVPTSSSWLNMAISLFIGGIVWIAFTLINEVEPDELQREFQESYEFDTQAVDISYFAGENIVQKSASKLIFGSDGVLFLKNTSKLNWENIHLIINPKNQTITDGIRFSLKESGFRYPEKGLCIKSLSSDDKLEISLREFVHTDTQEKFSPDRYKLSSVFIGVDVRYKDRLFPCSSSFSW